MNRIGFFAGAFDPIHNGHLEVARSCIAYLELNKLLFMVEAKPWGDKQPQALQHRQAMVDLAIKDDSTISQLVNQVNRFTINETLPMLEKVFISAELYFVLGADVFMHMNDVQWPGLENLLKHHIVVFERKGISNDSISEHAKKLGIVVAIIPSVHPSHQSSDVRQRPHKKSFWVPASVAAYIDRNELY